MTEGSMGVEVFAGALFDAVVQAMGAGWKAAPDAGGLAEGEQFCVKLTLEGKLNGEVWLELEQTKAAALAAKLLGKAAKKFGAAQTDALVKIFATAGDALVETYGAIRAEAAVRVAAENATVLHFAATNEAGESFTLRLSVDAALTQTHQPATIAESASPSPAPQVNLDLVLDVELNVTLRFGQRLLTLREVLDLTSGSVVELDRQVEEPVELLLEGKVIARGEAVVIDGNYGLRVTDVPQPISHAMLTQR